MKRLLLLIFIFLLAEILTLPFLLRISGKNFDPKKILEKPQFAEVLDETGIKRIPNLRGVSWTDYNNDGFLDLLLIGDEVRLFKNINGKFQDATGKAFGQIPGGFIFGVWADFDNDGCEDLFMVNYGPKRDSRLYHNNCNGTFTDVSKNSGIKTGDLDGFGAAWGDYDNDGFVDLYIANYGIAFRNKDSKIISYANEPNQLFHNNGDGTFTDVIQKAGVTGQTNCRDYSDLKVAPPKHWSYKESLQPIWFDYNNDGKLDLYVATDAGISPLYKNNGDGTFTEVTKEAGLCKEGTGMGVTVGDFDNSGNMSIYVTNVGVNYLWHNLGNGKFKEEGTQRKVSDPRTIGWGTGFFDFDNDGLLDLYSVNGSVYDRRNLNLEERDPRNASYTDDVGILMLDKLYKNNGKGFSETSTANGLSGDYKKAAMALADYNNDGFVDSIVLPSYSSTNDSRIRLYKNQGNGNNWITVKLKGVKSNKDAIGARILLSANGKTQEREVIAGSSFISESSLWQTFGIGRSSTIESLEIRWPSGVKQTIKNPKPNQILTITESIDK